MNLAGTESEIHVAFREQDARSAKANWAGVLLAAVRKYCVSHADNPASVCEDLDSWDGAFLQNGARIYLDHGYLEYSTPECSHTADAVAAVRAGDGLVREAVAMLRQQDEHSGDVLAVRNNHDHSGHTYGAHINIRMSRVGFERIFEDSQLFRGFVVPLFVTLPVICGSGSIVQEDGEYSFHIWQRGAFLERLVSLATTMNRGLINCRDEALAAGPDRYARLHIIAFDANMAEVAECCKIGLLRLLCAAIDAGRTELNLELADPMAAIRSVSRSPFTLLHLRSNKTVSPSAILETYVSHFARLQKRGIFSGRVPDAGPIIALVEQVLAQLRQDPLQLIGSVDWITKRAWLEQYRTRHQLKWSDPRVKWLDIQYHSLIDDMFRIGESHRITMDSQVSDLMTHPPRGSRAVVRAEMIRRFGTEILGSNWHWLLAQDGATAFMLPDDPPEDAVQLISQAKSLQEVATALGLTCLQVGHTGDGKA